MTDPEEDIQNPHNENASPIHGKKRSCLLWAIMRRPLLIAAIFVLLYIPTKAQDVGLSFSYFIPKNGYFSVPVTPFSIRGVGFDLSRAFAIESGFSLYRISGMGVKDLPWESKSPLIGPFFTVFVPLEAVITLDLGNSALKLKGGGFAFYNFGTKINEGNLDREMQDYLDWELLNTDVSVNNNIGVGYHFGAEYIIYLSDKFGISFESYYLNGSAPLDMAGTYRGVPENGDPISEEMADFANAKLDFTGYELSIGLLFTP
jgi:hypothetical protein